ncbi:STAS domain-containing protein [Actinoplanes sp. NEAU-A12]|uniref:STAS domain-containing protein n=1 Tax=Actinoplanes sandaracinus TaxID=3045177 RepID=A0ABT6WZM7_9ACTN|nr:STAS domain-containing protein [Actinoplanes sandaracinus]MDI6105208.1 STAS domain-containing protein [Actinoplanes sandaracinus]
MLVAAARDGVREVELSGNLDFSTVERARRELLDLIPGTPVLALNAAGLSFCDAAGLRLLLQLHDQAKACGCRIVVCAASPAVDWLLRLTDLAMIFDYPPAAPSVCDDLPRTQETHRTPTWTSDS